MWLVGLPILIVGAVIVWMAGAKARGAWKSLTAEATACLETINTRVDNLVNMLGDEPTWSREGGTC